MFTKIGGKIAIFDSNTFGSLQKKQKYIRANNANFMIKSLWKAIMLKQKFRNRFLKENTTI